MKKNFSNPIFNIVLDRSMDIETRIGIMYMTVGIVAALVGAGLCVACHAASKGFWTVLFTAGITIAVLAIVVRHKNFEVFRHIVTIAIMILIPMIFCMCGGNSSGCPIWFIYELVFIATGCSGWTLYMYLAIASVVNILLAALDFMGMIDKYVYELPTERDVMISTIGSAVVVCGGIYITVLFLKWMYLEERKALIAQSEELEEANRFEKKFLANMSHELRTPINSIIGFDEMIKRKCKDDKILEYAFDIGTSSDHLLSLVNDILDLSKIEAGEVNLNINEYDIREGVQRCYDIIKSRAADKGLRLKVNMDPHMPRKMKGDKERDVQIALNLLSNAVKYTSTGTIEFSIKTDKIAGEDSHVMLSLEVSDTGMGISEEDQKTIFDSYRRVDNKVSSIQGTGLGLAITKSYVELMGGYINVKSIVGAGSTFTVRIVQEVTDWEEIGEYDVTEKELDRTSIYQPTEFNQGKVILVVDDTPLNLKVIESLLEDSGCEIVTVNSGARAIEYVKNNPVNLILLDIMMPKMNGVDTLHEIRKYNTEVNAIALTANAVSGAREEYISEGFTDYLSKPVKPDRLDIIVGQYLK